MNLNLQRTNLSPNSTEGKLSVNGTFQCYTLEPTVREVVGESVSLWKIPGKTAIPAGTYAVEVTYFVPQAALGQGGGYYAPLLDNVPGFIGIRIHIGNFPNDTEGCILVGTQLGQDEVLNSKVAFTALMSLIQGARNNGEPVNITVQQAQM